MTIIPEFYSVIAIGTVSIAVATAVLDISDVRSDVPETYRSPQGIVRILESDLY
jgi:hypothetical protein